jgi:adenylate cyclase
MHGDSLTAQPRPSFSGVDPRLVPTVEVFERPPGERPAHDSLDAIAEWLVGPARRIASGVRALDEFAWRMLAAGLPLLRVTLHTSTLHPQYLGATFTWFRTTGQAVLTMVAHELADRIRYEDNPVRRVVLGGETLRRRIDVADAVLDFPILHDLKAQGATDYLALPVASAHLARNYMVTYVTDRRGGFTESEVADLMRVSQRLPVLVDMHSQKAISRNVLNAYLGAKTGPKVLEGQIRRGTGEEISAVLWSSVRSCASSPSWYADLGPISLYYATRTLLPAKTRVFVDFVLEAFRRDRLAERFAGSLG